MPTGYTGNPTPAPTPTTVATTGDKVGAISANHGHSAIITGAQLDAGGQLTLDITGTASHSHIVTLTADQIAAIKGGQTVTVTSTTGNGHSHEVTFN
jgi:hypothetical protein